MFIIGEVDLEMEEDNSADEDADGDSIDQEVVYCAVYSVYTWYYKYFLIIIIICI